MIISILAGILLLVWGVETGSNVLAAIGIGVLGLGILFWYTGFYVLLPRHRREWRRDWEAKRREKGVYIGGQYGDLAPEHYIKDAVASPMVWHENRLVGKRVAQTSRRVGIGSEGVIVSTTVGSKRLIPWGELFGPSHQEIFDYWNIYPSQPDGSLAMWHYCVVNNEVAMAIARNPNWRRKGVTFGDLRSLGIEP